MFKEALEITQKTLGPEHPIYPNRLSNYADLLRSSGQLDTAESKLVEALELRGGSIGDEDPNYAINLCNLANLYWEAGRLNKPEPLFREALVIFKNTLGEEHQITVQARRNLETFLATRPN